MPWLPELFSAPVLERVRARAGDDSHPVPYFQGVMSGETEALLGSFAGEPELHHPVRGRVRGRRAFERFVAGVNSWLVEHHAEIGDVQHTVTPQRVVEEALVTVERGGKRVEWPVAIAGDRDRSARITELRVYFSTWPLTGGHAMRAPVLQPDPGVSEPDVVGEYQRALAAGDTEAVVAAFEPDAHVREPAGGTYVHRGADDLRALFGRFFSNGGGIRLEHCAVTDDGRACALEYNVAGWGRSELLPQPGLAVYTRGSTGKLASAHIYDDCDPPIATA